MLTEGKKQKPDNEHGYVGGQADYDESRHKKTHTL